MEVVIPPHAEEWYHVVNPDVVKYPAAVLRSVAKPVGRITQGTQGLIDRMLKAMKDARGIGLAAPQIGVLERVCIVAPADEHPMILINPEIVSSTGLMIGQEGCLSIPGLYGDVERYAEVEVKATNRRGKPVRLKLEGMTSRVAQHEIDHLDGVLFTDRVDATTLHWRHPHAEDEDEI
jgi:peptide deformylase